MKHWSLRRRLLIRIAIIIGVFWITTSTIATFIIYEEMSEVLDSSLEETAHRIAPLAKSFKSSLEKKDSSSDDSPTEKYEHEEYVSYQIQDMKGRLLFRSHEAPKTTWPALQTDGFSNHAGWRLYTTRLEDSKLVVQVGEDLGHRFIAVSEATAVMIAPILIVLPVLLFLFRHILNRSFVPVIAFGRQIGDRGSDNLSDVSSTDLPVEFDSVRDKLNELLVRIRTTLAAERSFSSNSAHQLRTPVAAALAQSEMLERELDNAPQKERVKKLSEALRRLSRIVEKLLQLARADSNKASDIGKTDISELIRILLSDYRRIYPKRIFNVNGADKPIYGLGDADAFGIILQNLIENAASYGTAGTPINISVIQDGRLIIKNDCDAIDPALLAQLGERFVRGSADMGGSGLGLAIIQSLVRQNEFEFSVFSPIRGEARGFEAELKFKLIN